MKKKLHLFFSIMNYSKFFSAVVLFLIFVLKTNGQNDFCSGALEIKSVSNYCSSPAQYTNVGSTGNAAKASCWPAATVNDVWFFFTAIQSDLEITVAGDNGGGTIKQPAIELLRDDCSGTSIACSGPDATLKNTSVLTKKGLVPGTTYMFRVGTTDVNRGTFKLCVKNYVSSPNYLADCNNSLYLCDTSQVIVADLNGGGKNNKEIESSSCFYNPAEPTTLIEVNSSWFKWVCDKAGTLTFDIVPFNSNSDIDFILYELANIDSCAGRNILRCSATSCIMGANGLNMTETKISEKITTVAGGVSNCDGTETGYLKYLEMVTGKSYALMVNSSSTTGFTIKFGGTGTFFSRGKSVPVITANDSTICAKNTIVFDGSFSSQYKSLDWTFPSGIPAKANAVGPVTIRYNTPGTYPVYLRTVDSACGTKSSIDSIKVTIKTLPSIDTSSVVITNSMNGKSNGAITGIHTTGKQFQWYRIPLTLVSTSDSMPDLLEQPAGKYYLVVQGENLCTDTSAVFEIKEKVPDGVDSGTIINMFTISPNPATGLVDLSLNLRQLTIVEIELNNILGQCLIKETIRNSASEMHHQLDLTGQNAGIYFVKITQGNYTVVKRIVKQ